jgi:hypothetical protein
MKQFQESSGYIVQGSVTEQVQHRASVPVTTLSGIVLARGLQ